MSASIRNGGSRMAATKVKVAEILERRCRAHVDASMKFGMASLFEMRMSKVTGYT